MAQVEEYDYLSSPGTPRSPAEGNNGEKKKKGLKKLISLAKKKLPHLDKSASLSESGRFEEGSQSRRRGLTSPFKRGRTTTKDNEGDIDGSATPTRELQTDQGFMKEAKEEPKPGKHEKAHKLVEKTMKFIGKDRNEASNEESKPSKLNPPAEEAVKEPKLPERAKEDNQNHHHKHTQATTDAKGKSKDDQELESAANASHEKSHDPVSTLPPPSQEKEVTEHDKKHHHIHTKDHKGDVEDQKGEDAIGDKVQEKSRDHDSPPPPPALQEKEAVGCESLAQGLQKMCLPWTVKKEDH